MSIRENDQTYKALRADWRLSINKAHNPGRGILVSEVKPLMLASYRLMKCIRKLLNSNNIEMTSSSVEVPYLPKALTDARDAVEQKRGVTGLYIEANKLEALSRAAYRWLKSNKKLNED